MNDFIIQAWGATASGHAFHKDERLHNETLENADTLFMERVASCDDPEVTHFNLLMLGPNGAARHLRNVAV